MLDGGLTAALRAMLPAGAAAAWADPQAEHPLLSGEVVAAAVPSRLREFAAGRAAARRALAMIGGAPCAIPRGPDRAPVWPDGVTGSITHTHRHCLAVVMPLSLGRGTGIDLEDDGPIDPALWPTILRPEEREGATGTFAKQVFCAKEAAFKAQYPISRTLFGFDTMRIRFDGGSFQATFMAPVAPFAMGSRIDGRIAHVGGHVLTLAVL